MVDFPLDRFFPPPQHTVKNAACGFQSTLAYTNIVQRYTIIVCNFIEFKNDLCIYLLN